MDGKASLIYRTKGMTHTIVIALMYGWESVPDLWKGRRGSYSNCSDIWMTKIPDRSSLWGESLLGVTDWDGFSLSCQGRCSGVHGGGRSMTQPPHIMVDYEAEEGWEKGWAVTLKDFSLVKYYRLSLPEAPQLCHQLRNKHSNKTLSETVQMQTVAKTLMWEKGGRGKYCVCTAPGQVDLGNLNMKALKPLQIGLIWLVFVFPEGSEAAADDLSPATFYLVVFWVQAQKTIVCEALSQIQVVDTWLVYTHAAVRRHHKNLSCCVGGGECLFFLWPPGPN